MEYYEQKQEKALARLNEKTKKKGIVKGDLVLRYNSRLDKTFQKKFQVRWEGPFRVVDCFTNGTYQLSDLDGTLHASRVNGLRLKIYYARLMLVKKDELSEEETVCLETVETCDEASLVSLFAAAGHE